MPLATGPGKRKSLPVSVYFQFKLRGNAMAKNETKKESCPKCNSTIFAKATDKSGKYYCQAKGCQHVWVPGVEAMKRPDVMIQKLQQENQALTTEIGKLRLDNEKLKSELVALRPKQEPDETAAGDEIFT